MSTTPVKEKEGKSSNNYMFLLTGHLICIRYAVPFQFRVVVFYLSQFGYKAFSSFLDFQYFVYGDELNKCR